MSTKDEQTSHFTRMQFLATHGMQYIARPSFPTDIPDDATNREQLLDNWVSRTAKLLFDLAELFGLLTNPRDADEATTAIINALMMADPRQERPWISRGAITPTVHKAYASRYSLSSAEPPQQRHAESETTRASSDWSDFAYGGDPQVDRPGFTLPAFEGGPRYHFPNRPVMDTKPRFFSDQGTFAERHGRYGHSAGGGFGYHPGYWAGPRQFDTSPERRMESVSWPEFNHRTESLAEMIRGVCDDFGRRSQSVSDYARTLFNSAIQQVGDDYAVVLSELAALRDEVARLTSASQKPEPVAPTESPSTGDEATGD